MARIMIYKIMYGYGEALFNNFSSIIISLHVIQWLAASPQCQESQFSQCVAIND